MKLLSNMRKMNWLWGEELFIKYVRNYKFNSIYIQTLIKLMILVVLPLFGAIAIGFYSYSLLQKNQTEAFNKLFLENIYNIADVLIQEAQNEAKVISLNRHTRMFVYAGEGNSEAFNYNEFKENVQNISLRRDYIDSVYIYADNSNSLFTTLNNIIRYQGSFNDSAIESYLQTDLNWITWMAITDTNVKLQGENKLQMSIFHKVNYGFSNFQGIIIINVNLDKFRDILDFPSSKQLYLIYEDQVIFASDPEAIGIKIKEVTAYNNFVNGISSQQTYFKSSNKTGVSYFLIQNENDYESGLQGVSNVMVMFIVIIFILTLILCFHFSIRIFNPVKSIMDTIEANKSNLFGNKDVFNEHNEIIYIVKTIERTADKNENIEKELGRRFALLKQAQIIALQSQIQPHFLNNTLETINCMSMNVMGRQNNVSLMITALSKMFKMVLENKDMVIMFSEEVEHSQMYVEIMKKRYNDKFAVEWDIQEQLLSYKTIKIILQPIIENAIYHGIKPLSTKGRIVVRGEIKDGDVCLVVEDNGLGMNFDELEYVRNLMKSDILSEDKHIGLINVNQRIQLYFGNEYGLILESDEMFGTKVTLRFPCIM